MSYMKINEIFLNIIAISAIVIRVRLLYNAFKKQQKDKIKFEFFLILLIVCIWCLFLFKIL